jgi:hypothetical protein
VIEQADLSVAVEYFDINYTEIDAKKRKIDSSDDDFTIQDYCADLERHNTNLTLTIDEQKEKVKALEKEAKDNLDNARFQYNKRKKAEDANYILKQQLE